MSNINLTREELRILHLKHARRLELRKEFIKQINNPYKHAIGEGALVIKIQFNKKKHNLKVMS